MVACRVQPIKYLAHLTQYNYFSPLSKQGCGARHLSSSSPRLQSPLEAESGLVKAVNGDGRVAIEEVYKAAEPYRPYLFRTVFLRFLIDMQAKPAFHTEGICIYTYVQLHSKVAR